MKPRLVLFGTSLFGRPAFDALVTDGRWSVVAVVSPPARPVGRKQVLTDAPIAAWAKERRLPLFTPTSLKQPEADQRIDHIPADLYVVAAYGLILPPSVLQLSAHGALNIHASLLPTYRGASPVSAAILNGDQQTGITFMVMDAGLDTGPRLQQYTLDIKADDTRITLEQRLAELAANHVQGVVDGWLQGKLPSNPQPATGASNAPRLQRQDGRAVWDDATKVERAVRAYTPWPGVWTTWKGKELGILKAQAEATTLPQPPGTVVAYGQKWAISCRSGCLVPELVQFSGRRPQPAASIPGSYPGFIGAVLV